MKKSNYQTPTAEVVEIQPVQMIAASTIEPGEDNAPAGSRSARFDDED